MFNENSVVVRAWVDTILKGDKTKDEVPNLSNLKEEVGKKLVEIGYDIENEEE